MMRPTSIKLFEILFLAGMLMSIASTWLGWDAVTSQARAQADGAQVSDTFFLVFTAIAYAVPLILWYLVARRASNIAKWILTIFFVAQAAFMLISLSRGAMPASLVDYLGLAVFVLVAVAIAMLFRADARAWLAGDEPDDAAGPGEPAY